MAWLEYPKWVQDRIANSREEEADILGVLPSDLAPAVPPDVPVDTPAGYTPVEYPKWVLGQIVETAEAEAALIGAADAAVEVGVEAALRVEDAPKRGPGRPPKVA